MSAKKIGNSEKESRQRVYLTLPDDVTEDLHRWADARGMPAAKLASYFVMQAIEQANEKGLIPARVTLESIVQRLSDGEWVEDKDLTTLSHDTKIHIETLKIIRKCLTTNGGRSNVHTH